LNNKLPDFKSGRVYLMAVVNATPDSFYEGSRFASVEKAEEQAQKLFQEGADILDIGGESTRPGSLPVSEEEELCRVIPLIERIRSKMSIPISIDTTKSAVAKAALQAGATMINDISALTFDPYMGEVAAEFGCLVCLMHMKGTPKTMQEAPDYGDVVTEVKEFFCERLLAAESFGISQENVILDPGIGFGKRLEDNLALLNHLDQFMDLDCPVLAGPSRKSFIGKLLGQDDPCLRLYGTLGALAAAVVRGARILRVHDVKPAKEMVAVLQAVLQERTPVAV
jgi:dihydropteroate synthase